MWRRLKPMGKKSSGFLQLKLLVYFMLERWRDGPRLPGLSSTWRPAGRINDFNKTLCCDAQLSWTRSALMGSAELVTVRLLRAKEWKRNFISFHSVHRGGAAANKQQLMDDASVFVGQTSFLAEQSKNCLSETAGWTLRFALRGCDMICTVSRRLLAEPQTNDPPVEVWMWGCQQL